MPIMQYSYKTDMKGARNYTTGPLWHVSFSTTHKRVEIARI